MRVVTWNIQGAKPAPQCFHRTPTRASVAATSEILADLDADVIALQEVDHHQVRSQRVNQTAAIAADLSRLSGTTYHSRFAAHALGRYLRIRPLHTTAGVLPASGLCILTRMEVMGWRVFQPPWQLPTVDVAKGSAPIWRRVSVFDSTRSFLVVTVETARGPLNIGCVHLPVGTAVGANQIQRFAAALATLPGGHLMVGDMNMGPGAVSEQLADVALPADRRWQVALPDVPTFPNPKPRIALDSMVSDRPVHVENFGVETTRISDHALLWADLHWR